MKAEYPIEEISDENASFNVGSSNQFGFFPISRFNAWHGGYHVEGLGLKIKAICKGKVVAYRLPKEYTEEVIGNEKYKYSNGFVLIRHDYKSPKGQELTFYSLYMHLLPKRMIQNSRKLVPAIFTNRTGEVKGLNARRSKDGSVAFVIPKGEIFTIDTQLTREESHSTHWSKSSKKLKSAYKKATFKDKNNTVWTDIFIATSKEYTKGLNEDEYEVLAESDNGLAPESYSFYVKGDQLDKVVSCSIDINAGALVGYSGLYAFEKQPHYTAAHIEVFSPDDVSPFIKDVKNDGEKEKNFFKVKAGAVLRKAYPGKIPGGGQVKVKEEESFSEVQLHSLTKTVLHSDLAYKGENSENKAWYYPKDSSSITRLNAIFGGKIGKESVLVLEESLIENNIQKRKVSYLVDGAKKYWIATGEVPTGTGEIRDLPTDLTTIYEQKPDPDRLQDKIDKEIIVSKKPFRSKKTPDGKVWYYVTIGQKSGWIKEDDANLEQLSAYNWEAFGFKLLKDEEDQYLYDPKSPPAFLKDLWAKIDTDSNKVLSTFELRAAFGNPELAVKLSHLICYHSSEWSWNDKWSTYKAKVRTLYQEVIAQEEDGKLMKQMETQRDLSLDALEKRVKALCFWNEIVPVKEEEKKEEEESVLETITDAGKAAWNWFTASSQPDNTVTNVPAPPPQKPFPASNPKVYHFHPIAFVEHMRKMQRPNVIEIYHTGHISKVDLKDQQTVCFEYYDKNGNIHDLGEFPIILAQKWIDGAYPDEDRSKGEWEKITIDHRPRYYLYDGKNKTPLIKPYSGTRQVFNYSKEGLQIMMHADTSRPYHNPVAFATIIGALAEGDFTDVVCNGSVSTDGTGAYSVSHINGFNTDFKYLRNDKKLAGIEALRILVSDPLLDIDRQNSFLNALYKFGWGVTYKNYSNKNHKGDELNHCVSEPDHTNHLHIQGFKPNYL